MGLQLADRDWPLSGKAPGGIVMKLSRAESAKDHRTAMALSLRLMSFMVEEGEARDDFDAFVESDAFDVLEYDEIQTAIADALVAMSGRPTKSSTPSATGQTETGASSRDGSTSPGTVTQLAPPERYLFGRSAAS